MLTSVEKTILLELAQWATTTQVISPSLIAQLAAEPTYPLPSAMTSTNWIIEIQAALPEMPCLDETARRALAHAVHVRLTALGAFS